MSSFTLCITTLCVLIGIDRYCWWTGKPCLRASFASWWVSTLFLSVFHVAVSIAYMYQPQRGVKGPPSEPRHRTVAPLTPPAIESQRSSLVDKIPIEIIEKIIIDEFTWFPVRKQQCERCLARRCTCDGDWDADHLPDRRRDLAHLTRTCKLLQSVATRHLYRFPGARFNPLLLAQALMSRPNLAQMVELLNLEYLTYRCESRIDDFAKPGEDRHPPHHPLRWRFDLLQPDAQERLIKHILPGRYSDERMIGYFVMEKPWYLIELLISLCTNVDRVESVMIPHNYLTSRLLPHRSFPNLKSIKISTGSRRSPSPRLVACWLASSAPELECIELHTDKMAVNEGFMREISSEPRPSLLPRVKRLIFNGCRNAALMADWMGYCSQSLEEVHYDSPVQDATVQSQQLCISKLGWLAEQTLAHHPSMKRLVASVSISQWYITYMEGMDLKGAMLATGFTESFAAVKKKLEEGGIEFIVNRTFLVPTVFDVAKRHLYFTHGTRKVWDGTGLILACEQEPRQEPDGLDKAIANGTPWPGTRYIALNPEDIWNMNKENSTRARLSREAPGSGSLGMMLVDF
ncbi:hypothetical protein V8F33_013323 [Rhypophila sp. PSN 637]